MFIAIVAFASKRNRYVHKDISSSIFKILLYTCKLMLHQIRTSRNCCVRFLSCLLCGQRFCRIPKTWRKSPARQDNERTGYRGNVCNTYENTNVVRSGIVSIESDRDDGQESDSEVSALQDQQMDDAARILHILPIFAMYPIYWCLYDQQGSVWTLQAAKMQLHGLTPEQMMLINPLEIMLFLPLFGRMNVPQLQRMSWGMLLAALAFFISGLLQSWIQRNEYQDANGNTTSTIDVFWQIPQLTILAISEIFLSVTGLEFAYSTSPPRLKALLLGLFLATSALGDSIGGILYSTVFAHMNRATAMHVCAILMLGNLRLFLWVSKWHGNLSYRDFRHQKSDMVVELRECRGIAT